jgi:hypothetical protein
MKIYKLNEIIVERNIIGQVKQLFQACAWSKQFHLLLKVWDTYLIHLVDVLVTGR